MMLTMSLSMTNGYAEGEKGGNGGNTYHCGSQGNRLVDFELVRVLPMGQKMKIVRNQSSVENQIESAILKVSLIDQEVGTALRNQIEIIRSQLIDSSSLGMEWPVTADAGALPILTGCRTVNAIYYHSSQAIYQKKENMPQHPTDLAGLWIHEGVYKLMREQNRGNVESLPVHERAIPAQRLTALLFSDSQDTGLLKEMVERYLGDRTATAPDFTQEEKNKYITVLSKYIHDSSSEPVSQEINVKTDHPECLVVNFSRRLTNGKFNISEEKTIDLPAEFLEKNTAYEFKYENFYKIFNYISILKGNLLNGELNCDFPINVHVMFKILKGSAVVAENEFSKTLTLKRFDLAYVLRNALNKNTVLAPFKEKSVKLQNLLSGEL